MSDTSFNVKKSLGFKAQSSPPSNPTVGDIYLDVNNETYRYNGTSWVSVADISTPQLISNKLYETGLHVKEISTPANPNSTYDKLYPKSDGYWYTLNSSGVETRVGGSSSGGSIDFLVDKKITDFITYDDTDLDTPVNGIDGSPSYITVSQETSSPIDSTSGIVNIKISKSAGGSARGEGVSVPFSTRGLIDRAKPNVVQVEIKSSTNYVDGNFGIWLYDVTNSVLIPTVQRDIYASSLVSSQIFEFQTSSNSDSYRLIFHCRDSVNTAAYDLTCVVKCGPAQLVKGPVTSDWINYTPTIGGVTGGSYTATGKYRRVGDTLDCSAKIIWNTIFTGGTTPTISLPSGLIVDTFKIVDDGSRISYGTASFRDVGTDLYKGFVTVAGGSVSVYPYADDAPSSASSISNQIVSTTIPFTWANNDEIYVKFSVPILGWSSSQVLSSDSGARQIYAYNNKGTATGSISAVESTVVFPAMTKDKTASYNATTGEYTLPESGAYFVASTVETSGTYALNTDDTIYVQCAGTSIFGFGKRSDSSSSRKCYSGSGMFEGVKGDVVRVRITSAGTGVVYGAALAGNMFSIFKIQSPQQIAASEKCTAFYTTNTATTCINVSRTTIPFEDIVKDTHGAYNTSTGIYTCPRSGDLNLQCLIGLASSALWGAGERLIIFVNIAGVEMDIYKKYMEATVNPYSFFAGGSILNYPVTKGAQVYIQVYQESGANIALNTDPSSNRISISID